MNNRFNLYIIKKLIKLFYLHCSCKKVVEKPNKENLKVIKNTSPSAHNWRGFAKGVPKVAFFTVLCFK